MGTVELVHWKKEEVPERMARLRAAGFTAWHAPLDGSELLRRIAARQPAAVVIDLSRRPSHGCEMALALRMQKATRGVPLVFVEGQPEKVARIRALLPDAAYTGWRGIGGALRRAMAHPPKNPVRPASALAGYSGTPLPKKLGIKPGFTVALAGAPRNFRRTLGELPAGVALRNGAAGKADLTLWFCPSQKDLRSRMKAMAARAAAAPLWIIWPKQAWVLRPTSRSRWSARLGWPRAWWTTRFAPWTLRGPACSSAAAKHKSGTTDEHG